MGLGSCLGLDISKAPWKPLVVCGFLCREGERRGGKRKIHLRNLSSISMAEAERMSIYTASRSIKRKDNSLYNALRSIYEDSIFVAEIAELWRELPLVANLRCGLWYSSRFHATCYFKSTDGHCNNWSFSTARLNLHIAQLAGQKGGCIVVDSTRKGKRFPDSMSKTIPIWACVLNRAIKNHLQKIGKNGLWREEVNIQKRNIR